MDQSSINRFKERQKRLERFESPEYKEWEKELRNELESDYKWREFQDKDEMLDHSDDQDYEPWGFDIEGEE